MLLSTQVCKWVKTWQGKHQKCFVKFSFCGYGETHFGTELLREADCMYKTDFQDIRVLQV